MAQQTTQTRPAPKAAPPPAPAIQPDPGSTFPATVYNPFVPDERFRVGDDGGWSRFAGGRYVARTEAALRAALGVVASHRRGDPESFVGDDARREFVCREQGCFFRSRNEAATEAHLTYQHR